MKCIGRAWDFDRFSTRVASLCLAALIVALSVGAAADGELPQRLEPSEMDISKDPDHKYGESAIAVNPLNPRNIVTAWVKDSYTLACQAASDPSCVPLLPTQIIGLPPLGLVSPPGYFDVPRFVENGVFVTFNGGRTWKRVELPLSPPDHPEFILQGDAFVTVGPDGTFYSSWDALNWSA